MVKALSVTVTLASANVWYCLLTGDVGADLPTVKMTKALAAAVLKCSICQTEVALAHQKMLAC